LPQEERANLARIEEEFISLEERCDQLEEEREEALARAPDEEELESE
jgi:hypothetical protein